MAWSSTGTEVVTSVRHYSQNLCCEYVPTAYLIITDEETGEKVTRALGYRREVVNLNTVETVTEWRGMTENDAKAKAQTLGSGITMAGAGSSAYENASHHAEAHMANPAGGWTVTYTEKTSTLAVSS